MPLICESCLVCDNCKPCEKCSRCKVCAVYKTMFRILSLEKKHRLYVPTSIIFKVLGLTKYVKGEEPGWESLEPEEYNKRLACYIKEKKWIMYGLSNYSLTVEEGVGGKVDIEMREGVFDDISWLVELLRAHPCYINDEEDEDDRNFHNVHFRLFLPMVEEMETLFLAHIEEIRKKVETEKRNLAKQQEENRVKKEKAKNQLESLSEVLSKLHIRHKETQKRLEAEQTSVELAEKEIRELQDLIKTL